MPQKPKKPPNTPSAGRPSGGSARVVTVAIFQKSHGGFSVYPPVATLADGDTLRIINTTRLVWTLNVPSGAPFVRPLSVTLRPPVVGGTLEVFNTLVPRVTPLRSRDGQYVYQVVAGGLRAEGNSDPVIIIDNP